MQRDELIEYCLAKPGAEETYPWGEAELVAKVGGKAFAFIGMTDDSVGVKCGRTAEEAAEYRQRYPDDVTVSSYIGRYGWNRVRYNKSVPDDELRELLDRSYESVRARLPKSRRPA
ncbi:MAG: MmcQ/YjbR family DNA-binding protein [Labedaea sp.]